jgi:hypothetical protein
MSSKLRVKSLPLLPLLTFLFISSTILFLWSRPENPFPIRNSDTVPQKTKANLHQCHASKKNVWRELNTKEFKDVLGFVTKNWDEAGFPWVYFCPNQLLMTDNFLLLVGQMDMCIEFYKFTP